MALSELRGMLQLPVEQDMHFCAMQRLSGYPREARMAGRIQA
jgi:hypothetical protein